MGTYYHVVRLNYHLVKAGHYHQTHHFSMHRTLAAAEKAAKKMQKIHNCVDIVDDSGEKILRRRMYIRGDYAN